MADKKLLRNTIHNLNNNNPSKSLLIGFDGFVDEILEVVSERVSSKEYIRIDSITQFSERIAKAANLSANIELVTQQIKIGGNGPIMANALLSQGYKINYFGALGKNEITPVFKEFANQCSSICSVADPGYTNALEFADGKLMLGKMNHLDDVSWENISRNISEDNLNIVISSSSLIACNNWTMLNGMNSILLGLKDRLTKLKTNPFLFIDLADPQKRTKADIRTVLEIIHDLSLHTKLILSMNKRESELISEILDINKSEIPIRAEAIREKLDINYIVIHPVEGAAVATDKESYWVDGPYTPNPKLTTGAGDNFNAGFCNGLLSGLNPEEALVAGVYTSGYYVRNCRSPKRNELIDFIQSQISSE